MRRLSPAVLILLLTAAGGAPAADDPAALIRRAIKAQGGKEVLAQRMAVFTKVKGAVFSPAVGAGISIPVTGKFQEQGDGRQRATLRLTFGGRTTAIQILTDDVKGWRAQDGVAQDYTDQEKARARLRRHREKVQTLVPLLEDKGFTLTALGESRVEGRPALGIKVAYKGQKDVRLYFDKETALLVKSACEGPLTNGKEGLQENVFKDFRPLDPTAADERLLKEAKVGVEGVALLAFVRGRAMVPARLKEMRELVRKLGDDSFEEREKATEALVAIGARALPLLREAAKSKDAEVARRAKSCLGQITDKSNPAVLAAAVRLLGLRRPPGTSAVLLDLLPGAGESVAVEVRAALYHLAHREGKPDPVLVKAWEGKDPVRRAAAAAALGKDGGAYARQPGRRLYLPGLRQPMTLIWYEDGKKTIELNVLEVQFFNRFNEKLFAKP